MRRAAFVRRQIEMRWQSTHRIFPTITMSAPGNRDRALEEELFDGQIALPDDLLVFLAATEIWNQIVSFW
jgi:hypothetical protein